MTERLTALAVEIEEHVAESGWDQPPRLYALVPTLDLVRTEPQLAERMGLAAETTPPDSLTPVEQEDFPEGALDEVLAGIGWPDEVTGCALVHEAVVLPPGSETNAPVDDEDALADWAAQHPERRDIRVVVVVTREGERASALRVRAQPEGNGAGDELLTGPDLAPNLAEALLATLG